MTDPNNNRLSVVVPPNPTIANDQTPKTPSCVVCARRKVRCDRRDPCSACAKHGVECIYPTHVPPRRRKRQRLGENHRHSGFSYQSPSRQDSAASARISNVGHSAVPNNAPFGTPRAEPGMLLTGGGKSVYLDSNLWNSVRGELPAAEDVLRDMSDNDSNHSPPEVVDETSLVLGGTVKKSLTTLHPSPLHVFKLWQIFLENINPLIKILHGPSIQQHLLEASGSLATVSKEFEVLMFSIYCIALVSLSADNVQNVFGERKAILLSRYRQGARLAFAKAGILRTSSIVVLQAFVLYMLSMRASSDPRSIWSLCGVAIRMAQRIGLHRDGSQLGLSVFEIEMRRRLWRQLAILDATTAQSSGITSQLPYLSADVLPPSNLNDSDLDPRMTDMPREHTGATEMVFVLARNEFGEWMRRWSRLDGGSQDGRGFLSSSSSPLEEKERAIEELKATYETKFLQYCDESIPLHCMAARLMRAVVCQMRFAAHHPRQYDENRYIPEVERDYIYSLCLQIAEGFEDCWSNEVTQRYLWHVDNHIPWDALIYMLYEFRTRIHDKEIRRAWALIDRIYSRHYEQMRNMPKSPLHIAMHRLIRKTWKEFTAERIRRNMSPLPRPNIISVPSETPDKDVAPHRAVFTSGSGAKMPVLGVAQGGQTAHDMSSCDTEITGSHDGLKDFDLSPLDWGQWDDLLEQFQQEFTNSELFTTGTSELGIQP
ncbi:hypothetical protein BBP40_004421 [Aspergillus hancockii]|nr:hypothetical protein BBP40_004421 [Aspergillus hancockii]